VWRWPCWARRSRCLFRRYDAVVTTHRFRVAVMVGAAALLVTAATAIVIKISDGADHQNAVPRRRVPGRPRHRRHARLRYGRALPCPHPATTRKTPNRPTQPAAPPTNTTPPPTADAAFSLVVKTQSGDISANVDSISVGQQ
jgi:hypothetical protein